MFFKVIELPERDPFFKATSFDGIEKSVCLFFVKLIKKYQEILLKEAKVPLIFVLEDCHISDDVKIFFKLDFL